MTLFECAQRFVGEVQERPGGLDSPFIQWCHESCGLSPDTPDEIPWCSSFLNRLCWQLRLPRSKSARARSWLLVGRVVPLHDDAQIGDVVILRRGGSTAGPEVINAPGHVGLFAGADLMRGTVHILGGNQSDGVTVAALKAMDVLGVRRLT
jgi:uncharacterized protein (TIGR02594 family)